MKDKILVGNVAMQNGMQTVGKGRYMDIKSVMTSGIYNNSLSTTMQKVESGHREFSKILTVLWK